MICLVLASGAGFISSGGQGNREHHSTGGTPPGSYTITVTSPESLQHSSTVTLTVP